MISQPQAGPANPDYAANPRRPSSARRASHPRLAWLADRLSDRDWLVLETVNRLRLISGQQLERLCFHELRGHAREVVRGRVLRRLVRWQVLDVSPRRIGGAARGSAGAAFAVGRAGAALYAERQALRAVPQRVRHPGVPTERTVRHTLAVSELYVRLVEAARLHGAHVLTFAAEPASWWPNGLGSFIKPDAYALLARGTVRDHWWVEVDLATESLPTMKRKLSAYLDFLRRGQLGPHGIVPQVLVATVTPERRDAIQTMVMRLPAPASQLIVVVTQSDAATTVVRSLYG